VVNSTAIMVQWRSPDGAADDDHQHSVTPAAVSGVVRGYRVYVSVDGADPSRSPDPPHDAPNADATELVVAGLRPDTTYLVHVAAYTRRADGQPSRTVKVRTKGAGMYSRLLYTLGFTFPWDTKYINQRVCMPVCPCVSFYFFCSHVSKNKALLHRRLSPAGTLPRRTRLVLARRRLGQDITNAKCQIPLHGPDRTQPDQTVRGLCLRPESPAKSVGSV